MNSVNQQLSHTYIKHFPLPHSVKKKILKDDEKKKSLKMMLRKHCADHICPSKRQHFSPLTNLQTAAIFIQHLLCLTFTKGIQFIILHGLQIKK